MIISYCNCMTTSGRLPQRKILTLAVIIHLQIHNQHIFSNLTGRTYILPSSHTSPFLKIFRNYGLKEITIKIFEIRFLSVSWKCSPCFVRLNYISYETFQWGETTFQTTLGIHIAPSKSNNPIRVYYRLYTHKRICFFLFYTIYYQFISDSPFFLPFYRIEGNMAFIIPFRFHKNATIRTNMRVFVLNSIKERQDMRLRGT